MASIQYVVNAIDSASGVFAKIAASADGLDKQLADLSKRVAAPEVDLKDAKFTLGMVNAAKRLDKLSAMVADPAVEVDTARAQTEILRITAMLDRLDAKKVDVSVGVHRGVMSRLGALFGGGAAGAGGAGGTGILGGVPLIGSLGTGGQIGAIAAAIAALPFAAQAAAGGILTALGGGLTAVGAIAAMKINKVKESFKDLTTHANANLRAIGVSFAPAMESIFRHVSRLFGSLEPVIKSLATPFKTFSDALLNAFMQPAVTRSLQAVATAFGDILKALAPQLAGDIATVANGITNIAKAVSRNPRAFADFISFFFKLAGAVLDAIGWLTQIADVIEMKVVPNMVRGFAQMGHLISKDFDGIRHEIAHVWDQIFSNSVGMVIRLAHNVETQFNSLRHGIAAAWDTIWHNTVSTVRNMISDVIGWFKGLPGRVLAALRGLGHSLYAFGHAALTEFWNGLKSVGGSILGWAKSLLSSFLGIFGIHLKLASPSGVMFEIGKNVMQGLINGLESKVKALEAAAAKAAKAAMGGGAHGGPTSASAAQAQAYARSRLGAFGWGASQMGPLIALWNGESGWNRFARNPSSGAYGIPQALPASKMGAAANPPTSSAAAQINWGLSYIKGRYGSPAAAYSAWLSRSPHWYGSGLIGGIFTRPQLIGVGDRPERVDITPLGSRRAHGGPLLHIDNFNSYDATDPVLLGQRLSFAITAAGLGS